MPTMVQHLDGWQPRTWAAIRGVIRALLWWGVRQYVDQIAGVVSEIRSKNGSAWMMILDLDLADLLPPHGTAIWKQFDFIGHEKKTLFRSLLDRQPPKAVALAPARHWLSALTNPPATPTTEGDWAAVAELSYWTGHWSLSAPIADWLRTIHLDGAIDDLPLHLAADLLRGRWGAARRGDAPALGSTNAEAVSPAGSEKRPIPLDRGRDRHRPRPFSDLLVRDH